MKDNNELKVSDELSGLIEKFVKVDKIKNYLSPGIRDLLTELYPNDRNSTVSNYHGDYNTIIKERREMVAHIKGLVKKEQLPDVFFHGSFLIKIKPNDVLVFTIRYITKEDEFFTTWTSHKYRNSSCNQPLFTPTRIKPGKG